MRTAQLIFPPFASPTFVPTMLAEVQGYTLARGVALEPMVDLNIRAFRHFYPDHKNTAINAVISHWLSLQTKLAMQAQDYVLSADTKWGNAMEPLLTELLPLPDVVGLSLTFHQRGDVSQFWMTLALARWIKETSPKTMVAVGGVLGNHIDPKAMMKICPSIDVFLLKESEESWVQILMGTPLSDIPNTHATPILDNVKRDLVYTPDLTGLVLKDYLTPEPVLSLQIKRGCPWGQCTFCSSHVSYFGYNTEKRWERLDAKLRWLKDNDIHNVYWSDQMLLPPEVLQVAAQISIHHPTLKWAYMAMPHPAYKPELLAQIAKSGCFWITWGVESASPAVLKKMNKPVDPDVVRANIVASHSAGIINTLLLMHGFPGETSADLQLSLDLLEELSPYYYDHAFGGYHVTTGSPVEKNPEQFGLTLGAPIPLMENSDININSALRSYSPFSLPALAIPKDKIKNPICVMEEMYF